MFKALFYISLYALQLLSLARAWDIDEDSCKKDLDFMKTSIRSAFDLAQGAKRAVAVDGPSRLSDDTKNLMKWLFVPDLEDGPSTEEDENGRLDFAQDHLNDIFSRILSQSMRTEGSLLGFPNVKFYCNADRFVQRKEDKGRWYDPDAEAVVLLKDETVDDPQSGFDPKATCKTPSKVNTDEEINEDIAFAFTLTRGKWDTVTICPWFLEYSNKKSIWKAYDIKTWYKARWMRQKKIMEQVAEKHYTQVDVMSLFDKVLLHELMHTDGGRERWDVNGWSGYGWKNCLELARDGEGTDNCDSHALFANCIKLINDGCEIGEDGSIARP